jgi:uncharacterized membrane protein YbhN (UPF0104 family)
MATQRKQKFQNRSVLSRIRLRTILPLLGLLIALYVIAPRLSSFNFSWAVLGNADASLVLAAVACIALTNLAGAMVYTTLVSRPIPFMPMVLVQVASSFTNRLLPAGTGGMATCAAYLMKHGFTGAQAGSMVVLNNITGFAGTVILTGLVALMSDTSLGVRIPSAVPSWAWLIVLVAVAAICIVALWWPRARHVLAESIREVQRVFQRPLHVMGALLSSIVLTLSFALALHFSAHAIGVQLTLLQSLYILIAGVAATAVTPVPGGLGGTEAALVAALLSIGTPPGSALAAALLYRLVSYWLPILPGYICFQIALKKRYI